MSHNIRQRQQCFVKSILRRNLDFITCGDKYGGSIPLTRSSLRLKRSEERRLERPPQPCAKADINSHFKLRLAGQLRQECITFYLLRSESCPKQQYVGLTRDLRKRLIEDHNTGRSPHTAKFCPWTLVAYFAFSNEKAAIAFEKYLNSGSG